MIRKIMTLVLAASTLTSLPQATAAKNDTQPVIIAQHNAQHTRFGQPKKAEPGTGDIADSVADRIHTTALVQHTPIRFNSDNIAQRTDPLATQARQVINNHTPVIDIHGMNNTNGANIAIARGNHITDWERHITQKLVDNFRHNGWSVSIDKPFTASAPWTMSGYAESVNTDAVQIELAPSLRTGNNKNRVSEAIADAIKHITQK